MAHTVFFSWQASRSQREGRNLIERALKTAIKNLADDTTLEEAVREGLSLDKDTKDVPGTPPIFGTILEKIDKAAVFVPDLTSVANRKNGELIPNPNVLIEYGWALKSLSHYRIIPVMNTAYGNPRNASLPFDMAHLRFPMTYDLPEGVSDDVRRAVRAKLAKELEDAIRIVFESDQFKSHLPQPSKPPAFPKHASLNGPARFRAKDKPLGVVSDPFRAHAGRPAHREISLGEGAACWFRMMPVNDTGHRWRSLDLRGLAVDLSLAPILNMGSSLGFVRGPDGGGYYSIEAENSTRAIAYVFKTGEVWLVDSWLAQLPPKYLELDEDKFIKTLKICSKFLSNRLALPGPYQWEAGFEGISGRNLTLPDQYNRAMGLALENTVEHTDIFNPVDKPADALKPFFEKVFDCFDVRRPNKP